MSSLPPAILAVIEDVIVLSGLEGDEATEVRLDLEQYFRDGLEDGRTPEELIERFGAVEEVAPLLARSPGPPPSPFRGQRREGLWDSFRTDLRFAVRMLSKSPTLTATATAVVALGIAANTLVFTVINEALLRPLPVQDQESLIDVWADIPGGNSFLSFGFPDYLAYREADQVLEDLAAYSGLRLDLGETGATAPVVGQLVSNNYFGMLGLRPSLGRMTFPDGDVFGADMTVVLSHAFWETSMGAAPDVVGRSIVLDGHRATIIGVGPDGFRGHFIGFPSDLWLPLAAATRLLPGFDPHDNTQKNFELIGRTRPGVSIAAAVTALNVVATGLEAEHPETNRGHRVGVTPTTGLDHSLRGPTLAFLAILGAVSGLVLFIACLNVGGLVLVRVMSRDREMAIRLAIGAGAGRLIRQILTESLLLVTLGAVLGTWVASQINGLLSRVLTTLSGGLGLELSLDVRVLALTAGATLLAAVLASAGPATYLLNRQPASALRSRGGGGTSGARLRTGLVIGQVAVSVMLVTTTGLFVRALVEGSRADPGFAADQVATFPLSLDEWADDPAEARARLEQVLREGAALPAVRGITVSDLSIPNVARTPTPVEIPGVLPELGQDQVIIDTRRVGADFSEVLGIQISQGRDVSEADIRAGSSVAVVSEAFVQRFWPATEPLGQSFRLRDREVRVIGVAKDARYLLQDDSPDPLVYVSLGEHPLSQPWITVRAGAPLELAGALDAVVRSAVPGHPRVALVGARARLDTALLPQRVGSVLVGGMGFAALFLAAVGMYGLLQFTVTRDRHELGVRLALGGGAGDLLRVVLRKGLLLVAAGTALGLAISLVVAPGLGSFLAGVSPTDPLTYGAVVLSFVGVALLASALPARRAIRIQPIDALRGE